MHLVPPSYLIDRIGSRKGVSYHVLSDGYVSPTHLDVMRLTVEAVFDPVSVDARFVQRYGQLEVAAPGLPLWLIDLYFSLVTYSAVLFIFHDDGIKVCVRSDLQRWYRRLAVLT
jgi:hypothetical protein